MGLTGFYKTTVFYIYPVEGPFVREISPIGIVREL